MPFSARPATPGPSNVPHTLKRSMSDVESISQDRKKARRDLSPEPTARRDSNRDAKRRRKKKKKTPVVSLAAKNDVAHARPDERSRAPLTVRNEIIRFKSEPSEADLAVPATTKLLPSKPRIKSERASSQTLDDTADHQSQAMPPNDGEPTVPTVGPLRESSHSLLEEKVAQLEAELKSKNSLIASHQALLNQVQQSVTCQVCLDLMYRPYALVPCGHLACYSCLVSWFTAPPPDNRPALPTVSRKKTCPHCRAVIRERPVEAWGVKGIAQAAGKSGLLQNQLPIPFEAPESLNVNADPWKDIFPKSGAGTRNRLPWFVPDADVDEHDLHIPDGLPRGEDTGMLDMEDGGIYRCLDCMHEIWDGVCTSCGRVYPAHGPEGDEDDEGNPTGWLEDPVGAEEVDVADDPGWMGLEDGEGDDAGDFDDWRPFGSWRDNFHMFGGPWGFLGAIHVDSEDEDDDVYGRVDDLRITDEDEGTEDEGYESSFIGDDNEGVADLEDGARIYEIDNEDEDEEYDARLRSSVVEQDSDEADERERPSDAVEHRRVRRRHTTVVVSSDEEDSEPEEEIEPPRILRRLRRVQARFD